MDIPTVSVDSAMDRSGDVQGWQRNEFRVPCSDIVTGTSSASFGETREVTPDPTESTSEVVMTGGLPSNPEFLIAALSNGRRFPNRKCRFEDFRQRLGISRNILQ